MAGGWPPTSGVGGGTADFRTVGGGVADFRPPRSGRGRLPGARAGLWLTSGLQGASGADFRGGAGLGQDLVLTSRRENKRFLSIPGVVGKHR